MKRIIILLCATLSILCSCCSQTKRVLILTETQGVHKPFVDAGRIWLSSLSTTEGFEVTEINNTDPITKSFLRDYDLIIQLNYPPYMWTDKAQEAIIDYIDGGKGAWIGFHHASLLGEFDGYPMWHWASKFLGDIMYSDYIAELSDGTVRIEDTEHSIMAGVDPIFVIEDDEWYTYNHSPRNNVEVLANVDEDSYTTSTDIKMGDHPVIWINPDVKARNVYFQMGHSPSLFNNSNFVQMLTNAINWALDL